MHNNSDPKLVDANGLLDSLFDKKSRPRLQWVRIRQKRREIPFIKLGRRVFFDVVQVREFLARHNTIKAR